MNERFYVIQNPDARVWDEFVCDRGGHILQTCFWATLKEEVNFAPVFIALEENGALVAGAQILFRNLLPGLPLAYVPRGPVVDPNDRQAFKALIDAMSVAARARNAFALKIEPNWMQPISVAPLFQAAEGYDVRVGEYVQPNDTVHIDLTRDLDSILAGMKPKWRYNIRLAERKGVRVRQGTVDDVPVFQRIMETTRARDHFDIHTLDYHRAMFELLRENGALFIAEYEGEPLATVFASAFGPEAIYWYGGTVNEHRELMPMYAAQWAAIRWAKARGCIRYDLWGISERNDHTNGNGHANGSGHTNDNDQDGATAGSSPFIFGWSLPEGILRFKKGFGGSIVHYVGAYDIVLSPSRYALYKLAVTAHSNLNQVKAKVVETIDRH